jgi:hypothetical protein
VANCGEQTPGNKPGSPALLMRSGRTTWRREPVVCSGRQMPQCSRSCSFRGVGWTRRSRLPRGVDGSSCRGRHPPGWQVSTVSSTLKASAQSLPAHDCRSAVCRRRGHNPPQHTSVRLPGALVSAEDLHGAVPISRSAVRAQDDAPVGSMDPLMPATPARTEPRSATSMRTMSKMRRPVSASSSAFAVLARSRFRHTSPKTRCLHKAASVQPSPTVPLFLTELGARCGTEAPATGPF